MAGITTECLLFRLPQELCDKIYDLVFATDHNNATIHFAAARSLAPSPNLLLASRCIKHDAEKAFHTSYVAFWSRHIFILPLKLTYDTCGITAKDIHHMKRIRMMTQDSRSQHEKGSPYLCGWLDLEATDEDPFNWAVSGKQAGNALGEDAAAGLARWMKLMSRLTLKCCAEQQNLKKRRLDEIIAALWRLASAESQALNNIAPPTTMRRS
jgi:hypothetical protein